MSGLFFLEKVEMRISERCRTAYFAGLLDGEAYIGAIRRMPTKTNKMASPKYSIRVSVAMCDEAPIRALARFCGVIDLVRVRNRKRKPCHKPCFLIDLEGERAAILLRKTLPFMIAKRSQAEQALKLFSLLSKSRQFHTRATKSLLFKGGRNIGLPYRTFGLSSDFIRQCDEFYINLRRRTFTNNGIPTECVSLA